MFGNSGHYVELWSSNTKMSVQGELEQLSGIAGNTVIFFKT